LAAPRVDILMYHSVSDAGGATSIAPAVFAAQMQAIADAGVPVITMDDYLAAEEGRATLPDRAVILTFDDGFQDFAQTAWLVMVRHGFRPIVYLPTGFVGRAEGWRGIGSPPRPLMGWDRIGGLAADGVLFGSHTVSHPDLNHLPPAARAEELAVAKRAIEDRLACPVAHFAPPYGLANAAVRAEIARQYRTSVGTRLGQARPGASVFDLPRIEMFYFTDPARWRAHLEGRGAAYFTKRRILRTVRGALMNPWRGI